MRIDKFVDGFSVGVDERNRVVCRGIFRKSKSGARIVSEVATSRNYAGKWIGFILVADLATVEVDVFQGRVVELDELFRSIVGIVG